MTENKIGCLTFAIIEHECKKCGNKWKNDYYYDICPKCGEYVL